MTIVNEKEAPQVVRGKIVALEGANVIAEAMRQMNPDVVAAYPITPATEIVQTFSEYVADGLVDTEFVAVESEHAAMSACIGASAAGARTQTATAGAGLAFMWEMLWVAAGMRLPIVMHVSNRSLSAPLNILCDHTDAMGARDTGFLQIYAETHQEVYDNALQAVRIAEHPDVMLPIIAGQDGFVLSHAMERLEVLPDDVVKRFVGTYKPKHTLLDVAPPVTYGPNAHWDIYFEIRRQQWDAMEKALPVIEAIGQEYGKLTGRYYGLVEPYRLEDAELAVVIIGATTGAARVAVDELRRQGVKAGLLKLRCARPFPAAAVAQALANTKAIAVMDRTTCFGAQGQPMFLEVCTALFQKGVPAKTVNYVYGIGGRDTVPPQIVQVFNELKDIASTGNSEPVFRYLGLRDN